MRYKPYGQSKAHYRQDNRITPMNSVVRLIISQLMDYQDQKQWLRITGAGMYR